MSDCVVMTCKNEDTDSDGLCGEHRWIVEFERKLDEVMSSLWNGSAWSALEKFKDASYLLESHRYDRSMRNADR